MQTTGGLTAFRVLFFIALVVSWFMPLIIAALYRLPRQGAIAVLSLLLGWTGAGWVAALVIAIGGAIKTTPAAAPGVGPAGQPAGPAPYGSTDAPRAPFAPRVPPPQATQPPQASGGLCGLRGPGAPGPGWRAGFRGGSGGVAAGGEGGACRRCALFSQSL